MAPPVNVYKDFRFQVQVLIPNSKGKLAPPVTAGLVTGIVVRLSQTQTGAAIHADVDAMAATENPNVPGLFYVDVDMVKLVTHILPLGLGKSFFAIWKKTGDFDREVKQFIVSDKTVL